MWLKEDRVSAVFRDHRGLIWVLGDKSVSTLNPARDTIHTVAMYNPRENKFYSLFFDVCEARSMFFLASYSEGVIVLDSNYRFLFVVNTQGPPTENKNQGPGLSANGVYKLIPYKDSLLFITSNNGLSVMDLSQRFNIKNYYKSDGLNTDNFEASSGAIRNNSIYVGGADGVTAIDPTLFKPAPSPPAVFPREVTIETEHGTIDTSNLRLRRLEIPSDARQTTIYFSSIYYSNPARLRLSYRLGSEDPKWIDMSPRNSVSFIGINPGKYTLQIKSTNEDGVSCDHYLELTLVFLPKWYQTLWFTLLVIAAIAALLYAFYRYRILQLQKQQEIRKDIASDLHDDIGSTLNAVKLYTHLAKRDLQKTEYLGRIEESLTEASAGLRDMIWVLDDSGDTIKDLADRIKKFAANVTQVNGIDFHCTVGDDIAGHKLSKTAKRNLLLIAKEAITNSLKYGECRRIMVCFVETGEKPLLRIHDDGKGFDQDSFVPGNGLRNIRRRAAQIGAAVRITSAPGGGTLIEIS
jgi:signal transduction histidine kinase